jgi:hypothetical protein
VGGFDFKPVRNHVAAGKTAMLSYSFKPRVIGTYTAITTIQTLIGRAYINTDSEAGLPAVNVTGLSVTADNTHAAGLATGTATTIRSLPFEAALSVQNGLSLWLSVYTSHTTPTLPRTNIASVEGYLASHHVIDPNGAIAYTAAFAHPGDSVTVSLAFDFHSLGYTLLDDIATTIGAPTHKDIVTAARAFESIPAIRRTLTDLTPVPDSVGSWAVAIVKAANDLGSLFVTPDKKQLVGVLKKLGIATTEDAVGKVFTVAKIYSLLNTIGNEVVYFIQTDGGNPVQIAFTAQ